MQGDYMALNFAFPQEVRDALNKGDTLGTSRHALVVAVLDERGVATVFKLRTFRRPAHNQPAPTHGWDQGSVWGLGARRI